ncbi:MBL fold metallo-hydrolase [Phenylobacterium sp.]|uniref:MBL fold metallo-hydrolase n=1 Tax=Phenylobacterium sp. TaxID=1871053 RepID=UPI0025EC3BDD|nr:MBL fold metallo-hydrolase [Phenylobacterium sp.]
MRVTKVVITLYGLLFAAMGLGFWAAPERLAPRFGLDLLGLGGLATARADLGGAFIALSLLCLVGLYARRRGLLVAAAVAMAAIVVGRLLAFALSGELAGPPGSLLIEAGALIALVLHVRGLPRGDDAKGSLRGLAVAALVVAAAGGLLAFAAHNPKVQDGLFLQAAQHNIRRDNTALLGDDALRVALCGTSAPLPSPTRAKACVAVMAGGKMYIVDSGPESTKNLMLWGVPLQKTAGVFLTHFHSDHIGDLGELNLQTWVAGRPAQMAVYGGPGVEQVVAGFNTAYGLDEGYRTAHHTAALMPPATSQMAAHPIVMTGPQPRRAVVYDDGAMKITAIETNHAPVSPAYAYRFDYRGRSAVVTGDTTADPRLIVGAQGADVLFSEAMNRQMVRAMEGVAREAGRPRIAHIMADIQSYHIAPTEAADVANKAGVKLLVFYHLIPPPDNFVLRSMFARGVDSARRGEWDLAEDGALYTLPIGSKEVRIGRVPQ